MRQYLDLLRDVLANGVKKPQRARLKSTGEQPDIVSAFGRQIRFNLRDGFPLVTTRKMRFDYVVGELLWFLSGSTNNNELVARGVRFWSEWADETTGDLGPIYGKQWRAWEGAGGERVDQISRLVENIRNVIADPRDSAGRRLILTAWNPVDMPRTRGPAACHTLAQFNVTLGRLSCLLYQRSADLFLGVPYNIACYALLTHLLAKVTGLEVGEFVHTFGDAHIYWNHLDVVYQQLQREPLALPTLRLDAAVASLDGLDPSWMTLDGYQHHPALNAEVAV